MAHSCAFLYRRLWVVRVLWDLLTSSLKASSWGVSASWEGWFNLGVLPELFSWSSFLYTGFCPNQIFKQVPCVNYRCLTHGGKGKGLTPASFRPLLWLAEILAGRLPCLQAWGRLAIQSLQVYHTERLGLEVLWHRVLLLFAKAVGLTIGHSPEEFNET